MAVLNWTSEGMDWTSEATILSGPVALHIEALRLATVERMKVCGFAFADSRWDFPANPIWGQVKPNHITALAVEIDFAIFTLSNQGTARGWIDPTLVPNPLTATAYFPTSGNVYNANSMLTAAGGGKRFLTSCTDNSAWTGFGVNVERDVWPSCRWAKQAYDLLNLMTMFYHPWYGTNGAGNSAPMQVQENVEAWHGKGVAPIVAPAPCNSDPLYVGWVDAETPPIWEDITSGSSFNGSWNWQEYGGGAYRYINGAGPDYQYYRTAVNPDFDIINMSMNDGISDGFDLEVGVQAAVRFTNANSGGLPPTPRHEIVNSGLFAFNNDSYEPEYGLRNDWYELANIPSHTGRFFSSAAQFPLNPSDMTSMRPWLLVQPPGGFGCQRHWAMGRSETQGEAASYYQFFDWDKPLGFKFKL